MTLRFTAIAVAGGLMACGAAYAQTTGARPDSTAQPADPEAQSPPAATASPAGLDGSATAPATGTKPAPMQLASSSTLGDPALLKAGEPGVVSNGPVPDTPQNRATYGKPDSRTGQLTEPSGD